jgi:hypothetical protein
MLDAPARRLGAPPSLQKGRTKVTILRPNNPAIRFCLHIGDDAGGTEPACEQRANGDAITCQSTNRGGCPAAERPAHARAPPPRARRPPEHIPDIPDFRLTPFSFCDTGRPV